jgi:hypothetical protein
MSVKVGELPPPSNVILLTPCTTAYCAAPRPVMIVSYPAAAGGSISLTAHPLLLRRPTGWSPTDHGARLRTTRGYRDYGWRTAGVDPHN